MQSRLSYAVSGQAGSAVSDDIISSIERLLPARFREGDGEVRRQAVLIVCVVLIANVVVPVSSLLVWYQGYPSSAVKILAALLIHSSVLLLLLNGVAPRRVAHVLVLCFFGELAFDYGADGGIGILGMTVVPLVAAGITGSVGGLCWTGIVCGWCIAAGLDWVRPGDYPAGVGFTTALVATVVGVGASLMEWMREAAVRKERVSRGLQIEAEDAMQRFLSVTFPAHVQTVGGIVTAVSPGVAALLEYTAEDLVGRRLRTLLHPEDQPLVEVLAAPVHGETFHAELRLWHKSGRWIWVEVFGVLTEHAPSADAQTTNAPGRGEPWRFVARNIEHERQARERQARAHRLEGLGVMAGGLAHDFNNLLVVIRGFAELLPPSAERTSILEAASEASSLAAHLMAFGRKGTAIDLQIDVAAAVAKWSTMFGRIVGPSIRFETVLPSAPVHAAIPEGQLNQVLLNLVTNAKDAMPQGGSLQIRLESLEFAAHQAEKHGLRPGRYARLAVIDSGHGMSRAVLEQAVDPFFTTKEPGAGSGLGLATVYGIVTGLGGGLELESAPEEGTSVLVYLPQIEPGRRGRSPGPDVTSNPEDTKRWLPASADAGR